MGKVINDRCQNRGHGCTDKVEDKVNFRMVNVAHDFTGFYRQHTARKTYHVLK